MEKMIFYIKIQTRTDGLILLLNFNNNNINKNIDLNDDEDNTPFIFDNETNFRKKRNHYFIENDILKRLFKENEK